MVEDISKQLEELTIATKEEAPEEKKAYDDVKVGYAFNWFMTKHWNFKSHPERPERITAINEYLVKKGLDKRCKTVECPLIDMKLVSKVHKESLIQQVSDSKFKFRSLGTDKPVLKSEGEAGSLSGGDVYVNKYSEDCAFMSAGASVECCS